jgi:hypothetical protein
MVRIIGKNCITSKGCPLFVIIYSLQGFKPLDLAMAIYLVTFSYLAVGAKWTLKIVAMEHCMLQTQ